VGIAIAIDIARATARSFPTSPGCTSWPGWEAEAVPLVVERAGLSIAAR